MKKIFFIPAIFILALALCSCTRESSKTADNKNTPQVTDTKKDQTSSTTTNGDKNSPQTGQNTSPQGSGSNSSGDLPKFTQKSHVKSYKGCDITKDDCANIQIYYLEMADGKYSSVVNQLIKEQAMNVYSFEESPKYKDLSEVTDAFMKDYEEFKKDVPDAPGAWYLKDTTAIITNTPEILCFENRHESYLGGAHGSFNVAYTNVDMRTGKRLNTANIFVKDFKKTLNALIEKEIRKILEIKPGQSLTDGGLFENTVGFNENFAIKKDGIEFLYNQYEIAPYALGVIEVKLSYKDLESILNKEVVKM
ncbi:MAG: DUF3298 domain-containing protein [Bacteroidetes bacterium]|nr:DUF3298 domain-containing protein [Bacteroidota bacterium]